MKGSRWQNTFNGVMKFSLCDMLCLSQSCTLFELLDVIADLFAEEIHSRHIRDLEEST